MVLLKIFIFETIKTVTNDSLQNCQKKGQTHIKVYTPAFSFTAWALIRLSVPRRLISRIGVETLAVFHVHSSVCLCAVDLDGRVGGKNTCL